MITAAAQDVLELELRQVDGVLLVGFEDRDGGTALLVEVSSDADADAVRADAARLAAGIDGLVQVEVHGGRPRVGAASRQRVQLLGVTAAPGAHRVEIHLGHTARRVVVEAPPGDALGVAAAVMRGLWELDLRLPYEASAVHLLPEELGGGVIALLCHTRLGLVRRGLSGGRWLEEAVARAVLDALNRCLSGESGDPAQRSLVDLRGA